MNHRKPNSGITYSNVNHRKPNLANSYKRRIHKLIQMRTESRSIIYMNYGGTCAPVCVVMRCRMHSCARVDVCTYILQLPICFLKLEHRGSQVHTCLAAQIFPQPVGRQRDKNNPEFLPQPRQGLQPPCHGCPHRRPRQLFSPKAALH